MKVYESANIRNVVLVGHQGAGKTMLSEAMLFSGGAIGRLGSIADHSTVSDFDAAIAQIQERFGRAATVAQLPGSAKSVVDLVAMKQFTANDKGKHAISDIDAALKDDADTLRNTLVEAVAENDEQLTLEYLE